MAAALFLKALVLAAMLPFSFASGDHDHGHAATPAAASVAKTHTVQWYIPGVHSHGGSGGQEDHGTDNVGEGKKMSVVVGDTVSFQWKDERHDVTKMADKAHLDSCDFTGSTVLRAAAETATYNMAETAVGTHYISCSVSGHCAAKQKVICEVKAAAPVTAAASGACRVILTMGLVVLVAQMSWFSG